MKKIIRLGDIAEIASGGTPSRTNPEYWGGNIPWVKTGLIQNCIIHESDIDEWITSTGLKKSSAKLVPRGTILMAMIGEGKTRGQVAVLDIDATTNQNAASIIPNRNYSRDYVYQQLLFRYEEIRNISNSSGQQNLNLDIIKSIRFPDAPHPVQAAIAAILSTWDLAIIKTERMLAAKEKYYSWFLSRYISNYNHTYKHIRDIASENSTRNSNRSIPQVLSVTNRNGFVLPEDQFARQVASSDLSNYKIVTKGQYAYNPSRINVGSIARLDEWDVGVLSPMYVVFELDESKICSDFFLHWLESHEAKQRISKSAQGSVRESVNFSDFGTISIPYPSLQKQQQIAAIMNTSRQEIDLLKKQADALRRQKRGMMQKLLTGVWRVRVDDGLYGHCGVREVFCG